MEGFPIKRKKLYERKDCSTFPVLERKGKGRELCSLSAKMVTPFLSQCKALQGFTGQQESRLDSRVGAILADCRSEMEGVLININRTRREKLHKRKACTTFPSLEREGDHSFQRMVESDMYPLSWTHKSKY